jgi:hypothetical protein
MMADAARLQARKVVDTQVDKRPAAALNVCM